MRKLPAALAVACVALATATVVLWRDRNEQRARADDLQRRVATLEAAKARATPGASAQLQEVKPATATNAPAAAPPPAPVKTADSTQGESQVVENQWMARQRRLLSNPEYRAARKAQRTLELASLREEGMRIVGMTAEEADKLIDDWVERGLDSEMRPNPKNAEELAQRKRDIEEYKRKEDAALRELLGPPRAEQWKEFLASQPSRYEVGQLRSSLASGGEPLRDDQVEPLVTALHAERTQVMEEMRSYNESLNFGPDNQQRSNQLSAQRHSELMAASNERLRSTASAILSQEQLTKFNKMRARQLEMQQAQQRMFEAQARAKQPSVAKTAGDPNL